MPELASPPSLNAGLRSSDQCHPKWVKSHSVDLVSPSSDLLLYSLLCGQVLQKEGEGLSSLHKGRARGGKYLGSEST